MSNRRRFNRMGRNKKKLSSLNLTSLMDVFTILVFFLLFHSGSGDIVEAPKEISLPQSSVEAKPRETVVIMISPDIVLVQGEAVMDTRDLISSDKQIVDVIKDRLKQQERNIIGISTKAIAKSKEVTLIVDKSIPFKVVKKIMSTCTIAGYGKISLAVIQKNAQG